MKTFHEDEYKQSDTVGVILLSSDSEESIREDWNNLLAQANNLAEALWQFRQHPVVADLYDFDDNNFSYLEGCLKELAEQHLKIIREP